MVSDIGFLGFRSSVTSQWGEDGIIAEIFRRLGTKSKLCVEFGAWDGQYFSNTWDLWHNQGWSAILIEGDAKRARALSEALGHENVKVINTFVRPQGTDSIDNILCAHGVSAGIDLMSIDIDGDDFYILKGLTQFVPRVLVIEFNPTIPPDMEIVQAQGEYFGASAFAIVNLARQKGYSFVCCTDTNCIFVLTSEFSKLNIVEPDLRDVFPGKYLTFVVSSQDGLMFLTRQPEYASDLRKKTLRRFLKGLWGFVRRHPTLHGAPHVIPVNVFGK